MTLDLRGNQIRQTGSVYTVALRKVGADWRLSAWASDGLWPDLVVLLDVPLTVAMKRLGDTPDRV